MRVIFRVDASFQIGTGHVMRCVTLADCLSRTGMEISFICRELNGHMCGFIEKKGYKVFRLPDEKASLNMSKKENTLGSSSKFDYLQTIEILRNKGDLDFLIVDHYSIDRLWEQAVRPYAKRIMIIDDLANRHHDCDILLDQNLYKNMGTRYQGLVPETCTLLLGPRYVLLRPEFEDKRKTPRLRTGEIRNILIFYGGSDPTSETIKAMKAIDLLSLKDVTVNIVVGISNPNKEKIKQICDIKSNYNYYCQINYIADLMHAADLSLGAGGATIWERCFLGLPSIVTMVAENQFEATSLVAERGAIVNLGINTDVRVEDIVLELKKLKECPVALQEMSICAKKLLEHAFDNAQLSIEEVMWRCIEC